jgi:hypothetical protein
MDFNTRMLADFRKQEHRATERLTTMIRARQAHARLCDNGAVDWPQRQAERSILRLRAEASHLFRTRNLHECVY